MRAVPQLIGFGVKTSSVCVRDFENGKLLNEEFFFSFWILSGGGGPFGNWIQLKSGGRFLSLSENLHSLVSARGRRVRRHVETVTKGHELALKRRETP